MVSLEVRHLRKVASYSPLVWVGSPGKSLDNRGWMVGRHDEDGISWDDGSLDWGEGEDMEHESQGNRI